MSLIVFFFSHQLDRVGYIRLVVFNYWYINLTLLYSGAIIYLMVAVGNWISVSVVAIVGAKWSLIVSGALYV